ncbi:glycosyltransferase [Cognatiluteimonas weifangensis]|uniref:Glycosyltransferase n=1 Tax=Cognatiluteimonas weifangensis TaxID=2303539 RepID=A0A372DJ43_9GAMM|nr:glycosyltransferase [Luteimonas weifangensis]RFP59556.1 glycosyltransferase [Luteimonas weifangensis]
MPPERILVVIDGMGVGGSQRQIAHLLAGMDRSRWQPELAYFRERSFLVDALVQAGTPVHHLPKRARLDPRFLIAYAALLRRRDYALVHAFSLTAEFWTVLAARASGRHPVLIASERNQYLDKPAWYWRLKRLTLGHCAAVIANSSAGAVATAQRTGLPVSRFDTVVNGVDQVPPIAPDERDAVRRHLDVPAGRVLGLFAGRLVAQKNLDCLIAALAALAPEQRPWIALAGDGPLRGQLEQLAREAGVAADLSFLGERSDTVRLMQAADFLVLPSRFEGQSNALLEAMAAGCPVIASAVGGTPELVRDGRTGLLFAPGSVAALSACMARLCTDPTLRARLSRQAREHVAQAHAVPTLVAATTAVYERCLLRRAAGTLTRTADAGRHVAAGGPP